MNRPSRGDNITVTRYFYSQHTLFETSLDVYTPTKQQPTCMVVLVVGSAWMGHVPWIYRGTAWWNSALPRAVAQTSAVCVCIRHRGAFFHLPSMHSLWRMIIAVCVALIVCSIGNCTTIVATTIVMGVIWLWLHRLGQQSASFVDMKNDVHEAIQWVQQHKTMLCQDATMPVYFGGYSSGAHVAITVLQHADILQSHFQGIVLISGVLAVRPEALPNDSLTYLSQQPPPRHRWLTDMLLWIAFGPAAASTIPSPIAGSIPRLPHFIIACEHEVIGIPWLDVFFCSRAYVKKARHEGISCVYREIQQSNHWFIVSSPELQQILKTELPRLSQPSVPVGAPCLHSSLVQ